MCRHKRLRSRKKGFAPSAPPPYSPAADIAARHTPPPGGTAPSRPPRCTSPLGPPAVPTDFAGWADRPSAPGTSGSTRGAAPVPPPRVVAWMRRHTGREGPADTLRSEFSFYPKDVVSKDL